MKNENPVRWGCIGCGGIATARTLPGMLQTDNANLIAVAGINEEEARQAAATFGAKYAFGDYRDLLACDEVEAVYIASPLHLHDEHVRAAADHGKAILLEKPMARTAEEAAGMDAYCRKAGVMFSVGFMMRYAGCHQQIRELLQAGKLGQIVSMRARLDCWYPNKAGAWRQSRRTGGGGSFLDMGVHCLDLMQYLTGLHPVQVTGMTGNQVFTYDDVEDAACMVLRMDNGAFFTVDANFNVPCSLGTMEIHGTKGSIYAEGTIGQTEGGTVRFWPVDGEIVTLPPAPASRYAGEVRAFGEALRNGASAPIPGDEGIALQRLIEAAYQSAREERTISL